MDAFWQIAIWAKKGNVRYRWFLRHGDFLMMVETDRKTSLPS
jgi:hypothetical protein